MQVKVTRRQRKTQDFLVTDKKVADKATKIANARARQEILPLMAHITNSHNLGVLRGKGGWKPFQTTQSGAYGYKLHMDKMVIEIMQDTDLYDQLHDIGMESMQEAMIDSEATEAFVQSLLDGIMR